MRNKKSLILFGILLSLISVHSENTNFINKDLPTVDVILNNYIKAVGGRIALMKLETKICKGRILDDKSGSSPLTVTPFISFSTLPDKWKMITYKKGAVLKQGFNGEFGWHSNATGIIFEDCKDRSKLSWLLNPQSPLVLDDIFGKMSVETIINLNNLYTYKVVTELEDTYFSLYFDVASGLLVRIGLYWYLEDYRSVDGVLIPFKIVQNRKGRTTTLIFDEINHNNKIDDTVFEIFKEKSIKENK